LADKLGDADDLTAANAETTAAPEGAHADALDYPVEDYPLTEAAPTPDDPRARRTRWVLSLAVLLAAAAAFVAAGTHGMRVLTAPTAAQVTVTLPPPDRNAQFLADLARAGIPVGDPNHAVLGGYFVCVWLLSDDDERRRPLPPRVGGPLTGLQFTPQFIEVSKAHYCPNRHL
jgi:hypothetical protein